MNDHRKYCRDCFSPSVSERTQGAAELAAIITSFIHDHNNKLKPADYICLNDLLKQLNKHNNNLSRKALKGNIKKFEKIRDNYQR